MAGLVGEVARDMGTLWPARERSACTRGCSWGPEAAWDVCSMKRQRNREARVPRAGAVGVRRPAVALLRRVPREAPAPAGLQHLEAARSAEEAGPALGPEGTEGTEGRPIPRQPCGQDKPPTRSHHRGPRAL